MDGLMALAQQGEITGSCFRVPKTLKVAAAHRRILEAMGVAMSREGDTLSYDCGSTGLTAAWRWMAARDDAVGVSRWVTREDVARQFFSHHLFDPAYSYATDIYRPLFGDARAFDRLIAYLESNGYERIDNREGRITILRLLLRSRCLQFKWKTVCLLILLSGHNIRLFVQRSPIGDIWLTGMLIKMPPWKLIQ